MIEAMEVEHDSNTENAKPDVSREVLQAQEREKKRLANKPYIDHLDDAVTIDEVTGTYMFLPAKGTRLIMERFATVLEGRPWLDTSTYIVQKVNEANGDIELVDEELGRVVQSNFITGLKLGYRFKMPEAGKGRRTLPKRNKAAVREKVEPKSTSKTVSGSDRRIYSTRGIIHTRIKGLAYVPNGETKASDGQRLSVTQVGTNIAVTMEDGTQEMWVPNKDF